MDRNRAVYHQFVERRGSTAKSPPSDINACLSPKEATEPRPVKVDLFIATYSEDTELVRLSIQDALKMDYPFPIDYRIHVLDDGRRPDMKAVCEEEGVNYISRQTNIGFKAAICATALSKPTATSLLFAMPIPGSSLLFSAIRSAIFATPMSLGTDPQWFFDLPEGENLSHWGHRKAGKVGYGRAGRSRSWLAR